VKELKSTVLHIPQLGEVVFLFFIAMTTAVVTPVPGSCCWGGGGDNDRTMQTSTIKDSRPGDTEAS
jgi:hypothetical protein